MNESQYEALVEASWRRPLTPDEQVQLDAWLATRPDARTGWETECALNQFLGRLPDAPVASNFTAQVLAALDRERVAAGRATSVLDRIKGWFLRPGPRVAWALALVAAVWIGYSQHQSNVRADVTKGLSVLANMTTLSDPSVLQDFDAIRRLSQTAPSDDEELFAVLTQ
jgi:hypothetical protein